MAEVIELQRTNENNEGGLSTQEATNSPGEQGNELFSNPGMVLPSPMPNAFMDSESNTDTDIDTLLRNEELYQTRFLERVCSLPMVAKGLDKINEVSKDFGAAESIEYFKHTLENIAKPILHNKYSDNLDAFGCRQLDFLESKFPIIKETPEAALESSIKIISYPVKVTKQKMSDIENKMVDFSIETLKNCLEILSKIKSSDETASKVLILYASQMITKKIAPISDEINLNNFISLLQLAYETIEAKTIQVKEKIKSQISTSPNIVEETLKLTAELRHSIITNFEFVQSQLMPISEKFNFVQQYKSYLVKKDMNLESLFHLSELGLAILQQIKERIGSMLYKDEKI